MGSNTILLIMISTFFIAILCVVVTLNLIQRKKDHQIKTIIDNLEVEKNKINSTPIAPELSKVE